MRPLKPRNNVDKCHSIGSSPEPDEKNPIAKDAIYIDHRTQRNQSENGLMQPPC